MSIKKFLQWLGFNKKEKHIDLLPYFSSSQTSINIDDTSATEISNFINKEEEEIKEPKISKKKPYTRKTKSQKEAETKQIEKIFPNIKPEDDSFIDKISVQDAFNGVESKLEPMSLEELKQIKVEPKSKEQFVVIPSKEFFPDMRRLTKEESDAVGTSFKRSVKKIRPNKK